MSRPMAKDVRDLSCGRFSNSPITHGGHMDYYVGGLIVLGTVGFIFGGFILLSIPYWRARAKLTPEQRKAEDKEAETDLQQW